MKRFITNFTMIASSIFLLSGCSSILNPFTSEFQCPKTPNGKCISIKGAYAEDVGSSPDGQFNSDEVLPATTVGRSSYVAVREAEQGPEEMAPKPCCGGKLDTKDSPKTDEEGRLVVVKKPKVDIPAQEYRDASLKKVTKLLRDPVTPLVAPPHVMRVLIMPYEDDDGALNLQRFKYVMVDRPKWVLGDYLAREEEGAE